MNPHLRIDQGAEVCVAYAKHALASVCL